MEPHPAATAPGVGDAGRAAAVSAADPGRAAAGVADAGSAVGTESTVATLRAAVIGVADAGVAGSTGAPPLSPLQSTATVYAAAVFPALAWLTLVAWVYQDAVGRGSDHPLRSAATVAVFPPALVAYVAYRGERTDPQSDRERLTLTLLLAVLSAMIAGTVFSPPDVFAQPRNTFGALLLTVPLFYGLVYRADADADGQSSS